MKQSLIAIALTMSVTIGVSAQAPIARVPATPRRNRWASYPILRDGHEDETSPVESKAA
jgi:hypothetical protein